MIRIQKSPTADTRTCDFANTSKETLLASSKQHIYDVRLALDYFASRVFKAGQEHDTDKITDIDGFHRDFVNGFSEPDYTTWWRKHRELNRHHLTHPDGTPVDVNLIDVLDYIADCTMAGMARSGSVYDITLPPELLQRAFANTAAMLKREIVVEETGGNQPSMEPAQATAASAADLGPVLKVGNLGAHGAAVGVNDTPVVRPREV